MSSQHSVCAESSAIPVTSTAVVVATWSGSSPEYLDSLVRSLDRFPAGAEFDLFLVANGPEYRLPARLAPRFADVFLRENRGYNLAAWDHAWRALRRHDRFLFLQDDCRVRRGGWLLDFEARFANTPNCGLVGENLNRGWNRPWSELADERRDDRRAQRARHYRQRLAAWGVPEGERARHLTSVVHFTTRGALERVGGYRTVDSKEDAIAAEIAFSRSIEAVGLRLAQVGLARHSRIGHREWRSGSLLGGVRRAITERFA